MSANLSPFHTLGPKKGQWKSFEELVMEQPVSREIWHKL
jgi:hypothetical protein